MPSSIYCDKTSTIYLAHNPTFHEISKHIEIGCHVIREKIQNKLLLLLLVSSSNKIANSFTKPLHQGPLFTNMSNLGIYDLHSPTTLEIDYMFFYQFRVASQIYQLH